MSVSQTAIGQAAIGAGAEAQPTSIKPPRRTATAKSDIVANPEPR